MDLSANPDELDKLFSLLTGQGAAASPDEQVPMEAQNNPSGPISANTQNPIPNNASFAANVSGQPQPQPQMQVPSPSPAAQTAAMPGPMGSRPTNAASQPVAVSTPGGDGIATKLFTDPTALMLMGAALGSRSNNETMLQAASRGLLSGMQYMNLANRQQYLDQIAEQKQAQEQAESQQRISGSRATEESTRARIPGEVAASSVAQQTVQDKVAAVRKQLDSLDVKLAHEKNENVRQQLLIERERILTQNAPIMATLDIAGKTADVAGRYAQTNQQVAQTEGQVIANKKAQESLDAYLTLDPTDKRRVALGMAVKNALGEDDKFLQYAEKMYKGYQDPVSGAIDMARMREDYRQNKAAFGKTGGNDFAIPPEAIAELRANPTAQRKASFNKHFGEGAADRMLQQGVKNAQ